jgi:hypothetical protein
MKSMRIKKGGLTIKVHKSEIEKGSTYEKVKTHLRENPEYAYTRVGFMVEIYGYNPEDLNASFSTWPAGAVTQYTRIATALKKLEEKGLIDSTKDGKKFLYCWRGSQ